MKTIGECPRLFYKSWQNRQQLGNWVEGTGYKNAVEFACRKQCEISLWSF